MSQNHPITPSPRLAIIGLGYVGLPLARLFATKFSVVGFDINQKRIDELNSGKDNTLEVEDDVLQKVLVKSPSDENGLYCSANLDDIKNCNYYIVTVPTPVDKNNRPDLTPLYKSSETVGKVLKKGDIVIYESTVIRVPKKKPCKKQGLEYLTSRTIKVYHLHRYPIFLLRHTKHYCLFVRMECLMLRILYEKLLRLQHQTLCLEFRWYL